MPYIEDAGPGLRDALDDGLIPDSAGELNYVISRLVWKYIAKRYGKVSYQAINDVVGVLACAQAEFYRRIAAPYEDRKILANGEVFTPYAYGGRVIHLPATPESLNEEGKQ